MSDLRTHENETIETLAMIMACDAREKEELYSTYEDIGLDGVIQLILGNGITGKLKVSKVDLKFLGIILQCVDIDKAVAMICDEVDEEDQLPEIYERNLKHVCKSLLKKVKKLERKLGDKIIDHLIEIDEKYSYGDGFVKMSTADIILELANRCK